MKPDPWCRVNRYGVLVSAGGLVRGCSVKAAPELAARSQRTEGLPAARTMLLPVVLTCALAAAAAAPATYDQRQDGELNVRADVQNVVLLVAMPKTQLPASLFDSFFKNVKPASESEVQERADIHVMEAFVEPNTPYRVEIGAEGDRLSEGDGRAVEVVIAGRRHANTEAQAEDEIKLLGATEQCGPDRERDPVTLTCRWRAAQPDEDSSPPAETKPEEKPEIQPEVVPASS